ncbi:aspartate aminotransferase family protein [Tissierella creatinophila]|uniref:Acetylornithine aminotransferase n=1 Tax=Tissierella creatinophila DSM 6911 TaxID=1123403 RepID=A0A1U7M5F5_TISCR|nr:aspartate aminotransferase family protein [Tissierella creatinophila]OLS02516.1 acetylornithine aminotransferase [Tissierella creatinophila DSM 6911]
MSKTGVLEKGSKYIMNTYNSFPIVLKKGKGVYVWDEDGKKYMDFVAGIAVNVLGYGDEKYIEAIKDQLEKIHHCSNLYITEPVVSLAETLVENSSFDKVFFCNSGTEAMEAAIKLSRKYAYKNKGEGASEIISMKNSFHGRTLGALTTTGQEKYQKGFGPLIPGIKYAIYNDFASIEELVNENTCGIILEVVQGEGGVNPAKKEYLEKVRKLCTEKDIVLIFDEVQTGVGRTGKLFAHEIYGISPDVMALAKGLGGGVPIGAMMAKEKFALAFSPGDHASTFGGNPMATTAAGHIVDRLLNDGVLKNAEESGKYLRKKLEELKDKYGFIKDVRGLGLMQGIEVDINTGDIIKNAMANGLLLVGAGASVIRFVPPLIVTKEEIDEMIEILEKALDISKN